MKKLTCRKQIRNLVMIVTGFFLCGLSAQARAEKGAEVQATVSVKTVSRLAGDPGEITEKNAPLFKSSDGSPVEGVAYQGQKSARGYQNIQYSQTTLTDETRKLNKDSADFFADEQSRRNEMIAKLRAGQISSSDVAKAHRDETQRRQDYSQKQQAKIDEITCRGVKSQVCDDVRARNKKFFGIF